VSFFKGQSSVVLEESSPGVDFVMELVDFFEANVLRHRFCNASWYANVLDWRSRHSKRVFKFDISRDDLKTIDPETWDIFYGDFYDAEDS